MKKRFKVLAVCGSGTVTSSMVALKLKEALEDEGISISTTEAKPTEALNLISGGGYDFIINTSPLIAGDYGVPIINAVGFLTGFGEEEFIENIMNVIKDINNK
jgi:PTS system galactitol-specific IIB component